MPDLASPVERAVREFVDAINRHDPGAIVARCSVDHVFVDSLGHRITGEGALRQGWAWYFATFPDYRIEIETLAGAGAGVLFCGRASATHAASGAAWSIPAAWKAEADRGLISRWQVFADNKPVYEILSGSR